MIEADFALWLAREILPHETALRRWLRKRVPEDLTMDDVVQETYARLATISAPSAIANPRAYFFQTARSVILMHLRRSLIVSMESLIDYRESQIPDSSPPADEQVLWRQQLRYFLNHIEQMPDKARQAFELRVWGNLSFAEIGQRIGMTENAVQKNVARNLRILSCRMAEGGFLPCEASKHEEQQNMLTGPGRDRHRKRN
ncbi:FIG006045: Sigma factor, ECF subfamily [Sphingobium indicum BiD32]|uniref:FIG006045: Sigma factor, ECF subfamily n=1 Tax=Sphingobium indicum BiD32 TaxID=1301087 RepID=N1MLK4_9SPHN|nr:sigma-70 family RNA polymerase sigma factor [Sphingobium indicum]CCW17841.1 FIG006045: Sigma factor, ECF subfamily [Sphingobium indicum BiD32]